MARATAHGMISLSQADELWPLRSGPTPTLFYKLILVGCPRYHSRTIEDDIAADATICIVLPFDERSVFTSFVGWVAFVLSGSVAPR
jgi:hypothetical protein